MVIRLRLAQATDEVTDFLFVQTASAMNFDKASSKLTLEGIGAATLFFSDRPERIAGNIATTALWPFWSKGKDSFLSDSPTADVSILENKLRQVVVVLENPELNDDNLTYTAKVVGGEMPEKGSEISVFTDIIGLPLTPLSDVGARRGYPQAFLY